jgi:hypothetical protein
MSPVESRNIQADAHSCLIRQSFRNKPAISNGQYIFIAFKKITTFLLLNLQSPEFACVICITRDAYSSIGVNGDNARFQKAVISL